MLQNNEEISYFEGPAQKQKIIPGSHGVPVVFLTDVELGDARKHLLDIMKHWQFKVEKHKTKYGVMESKTIVSVPIEEDEGKCWGTKLTVWYSRDKHGSHMLTIKFESIYRNSCIDYERRNFNKR